MVSDVAGSRREFDARDYIGVFRRRWKVLPLAVLALLAIGVAVSLLMKPVYQASAVVLIPQNAETAVNPDQPQQALNTQVLDRDLQNEITFAEGDAVLVAVTKAVGRVPNVTIAPLPNADGLTFTAKAARALAASRDANTYASAYLNERRAEKTSDYEQTAEVITKQINALRARQANLAPNDPSQPGIRSAITTLQGSQADLAASGELSQAGGTLTNRAVPPKSPVSPNLPRNLAVAVFLGLLVGVWLVFIVERIDDSIQTKDDLDIVTRGMDVLAVVPWVSGWRKGSPAYNVSLRLPDSPSAEAYRGLRTSLTLVGLTRGERVISVTSATAGEGKSATVANLGVAFARAGRRALLIDCDFRRPRLHEFFGLDNRSGLTAALVGDLTIEDAIERIEDCPGLSVLPSGPPPPNPSELLAREVGPIITERFHGDQDFDVVIIDCPPVLPVPDAVEISRLVDGVLVVAGANARRRHVRRMIEILTQVDAPIIGAVMTGVRHSAADGYQYAYGYRGEAPETATPVDKAKTA